jgi:hypothetical protein
MPTFCPIDIAKNTYGFRPIQRTPWRTKYGAERDDSPHLLSNPRIQHSTSIWVCAYRICKHAVEHYHYHKNLNSCLHFNMKGAASLVAPKPGNQASQPMMTSNNSTDKHSSTRPLARYAQFPWVHAVEQINHVSAHLFKKYVRSTSAVPLRSPWNKPCILKSSRAVQMECQLNCSERRVSAG